MDARARLRALERARSLSNHLPPQWSRRVREIGKVVFDYRGARSTVGRARQYAQLRRASSIAAVPFGRASLLVDTSDDEIGRMVFISGGYERIYMSTALRYLTSIGITTAGTTFVDVGANIGTSTVDALVEFGFGRAIAFEPSSKNFRLLRMNIIANELEDRVELHRMAVSDADGDVVLALSPGNSGDHRVVATRNGWPGGETETVPCVTLDSLDIANVGLIWIDAQGHEAAVLAGATKAMAAGAPVFLEYWPQTLGPTLDRLENLVAGAYGSVLDVRRLAAGVDDDAVVAASDMRLLRDRYRGVSLTDLLLLPRR